MPRQIGKGSKTFGPVATVSERGDWKWYLGYILLVILLIILSPWNKDDEAGAQAQTPNCELFILDPIGGGNPLDSFSEMAVPTNYELPDSVIQPGWTIYVVLGDQCPEIGMTLYEHPDNSVVVAHPGSVVVSEDFPWELPNGVGGIAITVPEDWSPCAYQLDLYRGGQLDDFSRGARYGPRLIDAINWYSVEESCTNTEQESTTTTSTLENTTTTVTELESTTTVVDTTSSTSTSGQIDTTPSEGSNRVESLPATGGSTANLLLIGIFMAAVGLILTYRHRFFR